MNRKKDNLLAASAIVFALVMVFGAMLYHQLVDGRNATQIPSGSMAHQAVPCPRNEPMTFRVNVKGLQAKYWSVPKAEGSVKVDGESLTLAFAFPNNPPAPPADLAHVRYDDRKGNSIEVVFRGINGADLKSAGAASALGNVPKEEIRVYGGSHMYVWGTERGVRLPTASSGFGGNKVVTAYIPK